MSQHYWLTHTFKRIYIRTRIHKHIQTDTLQIVILQVSYRYPYYLSSPLSPYPFWVTYLQPYTRTSNRTGFSLAYGLCSALDTLISQAYGAKAYRLTGVYAQRAAFILTLSSIPVAALWWVRFLFILKSISVYTVLMHPITRLHHIFSPVRPLLSSIPNLHPKPKPKSSSCCTSQVPDRRYPAILPSHPSRNSTHRWLMGTYSHARYLHSHRRNCFASSCLNQCTVALKSFAIPVMM